MARTAIALYDRISVSVLEKQSSQDNFSMDIRGLAPGIYVLHLSNGYGMQVFTEKVLIR